MAPQHPERRHERGSLLRVDFQEVAEVFYIPNRAEAMDIDSLDQLLPEESENFEASMPTDMAIQLGGTNAIVPRAHPLSVVSERNRFPAPSSIPTQSNPPEDDRNQRIDTFSSMSHFQLPLGMLCPGYHKAGTYLVNNIRAMTPEDSTLHNTETGYRTSNGNGRPAPTPHDPRRTLDGTTTGCVVGGGTLNYALAPVSGMKTSILNGRDAAISEVERSVINLDTVNYNDIPSLQQSLTLQHRGYNLVHNQGPLYDDPDTALHSPRAEALGESREAPSPNSNSLSISTILDGLSVDPSASFYDFSLQVGAPVQPMLRLAPESSPSPPRPHTLDPSISSQEDDPLPTYRRIAGATRIKNNPAYMRSRGRSSLVPPPRRPGLRVAETEELGMLAALASSYAGGGADSTAANPPISQAPKRPTQSTAGTRTEPLISTTVAGPLKQHQKTGGINSNQKHDPLSTPKRTTWKPAPARPKKPATGARVTQAVKATTSLAQPYDCCPECKTNPENRKHPFEVVIWVPHHTKVITIITSSPEPGSLADDVSSSHEMGSEDTPTRPRPKQGINPQKRKRDESAREAPGPAKRQDKKETRVSDAVGSEVPKKYTPQEQVLKQGAKAKAGRLVSGAPELWPPGGSLFPGKGIPSTRGPKGPSVSSARNYTTIQEPSKSESAGTKIPAKITSNTAGGRPLTGQSGRSSLAAGRAPALGGLFRSRVRPATASLGADIALPTREIIPPSQGGQRSSCPPATGTRTIPAATGTSTTRSSHPTTSRPTTGYPAAVAQTSTPSRHLTAPAALRPSRAATSAVGVSVSAAPVSVPTRAPLVVLQSTTGPLPLELRRDGQGEYDLILANFARCQTARGPGGQGSATSINARGFAIRRAARRARERGE